VTLFELLYWIVPLSLGFATGYLLTCGVDSRLLRIGVGIVVAIISQAIFLQFLIRMRKRWEKSEPTE